MAVALVVVLGGAFGALSRYGVDEWIERRVESSFPWSTFVINTSGCFAVGFVIVALVDRHRAPEWLRVGLVVGLCGGYTTFRLSRRRHWISSKLVTRGWRSRASRRASWSASLQYWLAPAWAGLV